MDENRINNENSFNESQTNENPLPVREPESVSFSENAVDTPSAPQQSFTPPVSQQTPRYNGTIPPTPRPRPTASTVKKPKKEKRFSFATVVVSVLLAGIIGATAGGTVAAVVGILTNLGGDDSTIYENLGSIAQGSGDKVNIDVQNYDATLGVAIAEKVTPSVVGIRTTISMANFFGNSEETSGEGSGVIYKSDGYIITNYHVISDAIDYGSSANIHVFLSDDSENSYPATVVGYNISCDLAVIKINGNNLPVIEMGDSADLKVGQTVIAIGSPGGLEFMGSVTMGIVSGLNRIMADAYDSETVQLIQTDAAINPGNSGGALVNEQGKLVGINSSKIVSEGFEGMGFAIPSNTVKTICDKIIARETTPTPYIGISVSERYDAQTLEALGYPAGAVVYSVVYGGPAQKAGIRQGDIITMFNGATITEYTRLYDAIADCQPGDNVKYKIYRSGKYYEGTITVGSNNSQ